MKTLTIFYDPHCGLCTTFRKWLEAQPKWVAVNFTGYDTPEAAVAFPGLQARRADREIIVLADDGRWWQGDSAWLTCLWTTREFRAWSFRLAAPVFQPLVKKVVHLLSENRLTLSRLFRLKHDAQLASALNSIANPTCATAACAVPPRISHPPIQ